MPDISKCPGTDCPMRDSCYRYTAESNGLWQAYFTKAPVELDWDGRMVCEYHWPNKQEKYEKSN